MAIRMVGRTRRFRLENGIQTHGSMRMSAGCIATAILSRSEGLFNAFDDRVELSLALGRINQCEAIDDPVAAAEHHLFVEYVASVFARQHKPRSPPRSIIHIVPGIGLPPDH